MMSSSSYSRRRRLGLRTLEQVERVDQNAQAAPVGVIHEVGQDVGQ